jgi:type VI secretion system protein ImpH
MAAESRGTDPSLEQLLFKEGYRFDFFQAVRLLERLFPERTPISGDGVPSNEAIRFRSHPSLSFPASQIHEIVKSKERDRQAEVSVAFMGLTGPLGVLPFHYTELVLERLRQKDETLRDFLDIFNHRMLSLFYRAWEKYRIPLSYERALYEKRSDDSFAVKLFSLIGMGTEGLRDRSGVDQALFYHVGLLGQRPHSATTLENILRNYFELPVRVLQFLGDWLDVSREDRSRIGVSGANNVLGATAFVGRRVWDQQAKFKVKIGPIVFVQFLRLLPSGDAYQPLVQLVRFIVGQEYVFEIQLVLLASEVPRCRIGLSSRPTPRLGWSAWLKTKEFSRDAEDAVLAAYVSECHGKESGHECKYQVLDR